MYSYKVRYSFLLVVTHPPRFIGIVLVLPYCRADTPSQAVFSLVVSALLLVLSACSRFVNARAMIEVNDSFISCDGCLCIQRLFQWGTSEFSIWIRFVRGYSMLFIQFYAPHGCLMEYVMELPHGICRHGIHHGMRHGMPHGI